MARGKASFAPKVFAMFNCMATSTAFDAPLAQQNMIVMNNICPSLSRELLLTVQNVYRDVCRHGFFFVFPFFEPVSSV